jgi:multiple sugar transport system permease protein
MAHTVGQPVLTAERESARAGARGRAPSARRPPGVSLTCSMLPVYFIAPTVLLLLLVVAYPIAYSIWASVHRTEYLKIGDAIGLRHYTTLLADEVVRRDVVISLKYVIGSLAGAVPFGLLLALVLDQRLPLTGWFRTICALPWVISQTVTALLWIWLLDPSFGPVNYLLDAIGAGRVNFLASEATALPVLVAVNVWMSYPFAMILFLAGLQTIPQEVHEAALIDGASPLWKFLSVTLPLLRSTVVATCVMLTLYYFTMVTLILIFTGGGPVGSTEVLSLRVFNETFLYWRVGQASALGVVIFALNAVFSLVYVRVIRTAPEGA